MLKFLFLSVELLVMSFASLGYAQDLTIHKDKTLGWSISYPTTWASGPGRGINTLIVVSARDRSLANCNVNYRKLPELSKLSQGEIDKEVAGFTDADIKGIILESLPEVQIIKGEHKKIGVMPALYGQVVNSVDGLGLPNGLKMTLHMIYVFTPRGMFALACGVEASVEPQLRPLLFLILNTFTVLRG